MGGARAETPAAIRIADRLSLGLLTPQWPEMKQMIVELGTSALDAESLTKLLRSVVSFADTSAVQFAHVDVLMSGPDGVLLAALSQAAILTAAMAARKTPAPT